MAGGRRGVLAAGLAAAAPARAQPRAEAAFPQRPVRLVVAYPAGGSTDVVGRLLAERLARAWGQPVIVENRPGAAGTLGADVVAKSPADGHTLLVGASGELAVARAGLRSIPYQPGDFAPIALLTEQPLLVLVNAGLPVASLAAFIAYARARPGQLNYASFGNATANHLLTELLRLETGIVVTHVPYRGAAPAMTDLLAGQVQFALDTIPTALPQLAAEKLRALALTRATRSAALPEVPTTVELGLPDVVGGTWAALVAPARTPAAVLEQIGETVQAAFREGLGSAFRERGLEPVGADAATTAGFIAAEQRKWLAMAARTGIQPE